MKRIAVAIVLASLVLIGCVASVAATQIYAGDANVTWLLDAAGTVGWLYVQNGGSVAATTVRLALGEAAVIDGGYTLFWDGSYEYVVLPTALSPGDSVALTVAGAAGVPIGLTGVELGDFYTWFTVPAGTQATVDALVGGSVVVKSADGAINTLFIVNSDAPAAFLDIRGSGVLIGGGLTTYTEGSDVYVNLGAPTVAGGVTAVKLLGGQVERAAFVADNYSWLTVPAGTQASIQTLADGAVVVKSADGAIDKLFVKNPNKSALVARVRGSGVAIGDGFATFSNGGYVYVNLGVPTVAGRVTALPLLGGQVDSIDFGSWAIWSVASSGTSVLLTVRNASERKDALAITLYNAVAIDLDHSYVYKADGTLVPFTLAADHPSKYTRGGARTWVESDMSGGLLVRLWLPTFVEPFEYVVVKIDVAGAPINVFSAEFGVIQ